MIRINTNSSLVMGGVTRQGTLRQNTESMAQALGSLVIHFSRAYRNNIARLAGQRFIDRLRQALPTQQFAGASVPLSPLTGAIRDAFNRSPGTGPLVDRGTLSAGAYQRPAGGGKVIVSFRGNASVKPGATRVSELGLVASKMEEGYSFTVTKRMANFLRGLTPGKVGTTIYVPARPFFASTLRDFAPELAELMRQTVQHDLDRMQPTGVPGDTLASVTP